MAFWDSRIEGQVISGDLKDAILPDFELIPNNTTAPAQIKSFELVSKKVNDKDVDQYEIVWKLMSGDFKGREVTQKIKAFDDKDTIAQRALNMLKLIYTLCAHIPKHSNVPSNEDHRSMVGKILGIKIGEWNMPRTNLKPDQSPFLTGNNVTEVHPVNADFKTETGVKRELPKVTTSAVESAFSRNPPAVDNLDVPW
jgi:hypothetical protein